MKTRNQNLISGTGNSTQRGKAARLAVAMAVPALALSACYIIPMDHYGRPVDYNGRPIVINQRPQRRRR